MPRDAAPARARLRAAALRLYRDHGYDETTTAHIAQHAGVTERTFFRHFADKREVLFDGETELRAILVDAVGTAPANEPPLRCVIRAFRATVPLLVANRATAVARAEVIDANPALRERAHAKIAGLVDALSQALTARGVEPATARLSAGVGMAAFEWAAGRWTGASATELLELLDEAVPAVRIIGEPTRAGPEPGS